jgi:hypothetical protein
MSADGESADESGAAPFRMIDLPVIPDRRGDLAVAEGGRHVPFDIARVYYVYNAPVDAVRGGHAHRELSEVVFALSGSFRVAVDDGTRRAEFRLRDPRRGLLIGRMVWRVLDEFSQGAVCLVLASQPYDEAEYIRDYDAFLAEARG